MKEMIQMIFSGETLYALVFTALAAIIILGALGVVFLPNIIHSAYCLILTFLGVAGLYLQAGAGFVGIMQIMVYGGAISVLVIFAVMLVMDREPRRTSPLRSGKAPWIAGYGAFLFIAAMIVTVTKTVWPSEGSGLPEGMAMALIADQFLGNYIVAFEAAAILLLVAVVGALILAKGVEEK